MTITVHLRFFAAIREALGRGSESCATTATDVATLRDTLIARGAPYADALARGKSVRIAVDQRMCDDESMLLHDGAEVAFFPPVTGG